jgi:hypothetical protein
MADPAQPHCQDFQTILYVLVGRSDSDQSVSSRRHLDGRPFPLEVSSHTVPSLGAAYELIAFDHRAHESQQPYQEKSRLLRR